MENDILQILRWRRRATSPTLAQFKKHYMGQWDLKEDKYGNLYKRVGTAPILWSCHLDTVHRKDGWQNVRIDSDGYIKQKGMKSRCLGADDGAGIWLLLEMINNNKEGLYVFHMDEEVGGKGSDWISTWNDQFLKDIKFAVAFDRKGTKSIITDQYGVCCSDLFALSLANELDMGHVIDTTGRFTDTDNYKEHIPECTNVSVGYYDEHTPNEKLDWEYLQKLRDAVLGIDYNNLVVERDPDDYSYYSSGRRSYASKKYTYTKNYDNPWSPGYYDGRGRVRAKCHTCHIYSAVHGGVYLGSLFYCSYACAYPKDDNKVPSSQETNIENIDRLCSLNSRKMARLFLSMGATYEDVLRGFLDLDERRASLLLEHNKGEETTKKEGWLDRVVRHVLGGK